MWQLLFEIAICRWLIVVILWLSEAEQENKRQDKVLDDDATRQIMKDKLVKQLKEKGITAKVKKAAITKIAQEHETKKKRIQGWEGKPNGLLQVLSA